MLSRSQKTSPFSISHKVFFNETNAVGGVVYFSNYIKWQGIAREEYFVSTVPEWRDIVADVSQGRLNMMTVEEHSYFLNHAFFGDTVEIQLQTINIRSYSFIMLFVISNQKHERLYEGMQKLAFDDFQGNYVKIPPPMLKSVRERQYQGDVSEFKKLKLYL